MIPGNYPGFPNPCSFGSATNAETVLCGCESPATLIQSLAQSNLPGGGFCKQVLTQQQEQVQHSRASSDLTQLRAGRKKQTENNQKQKTSADNPT